MDDEEWTEVEMPKIDQEPLLATQTRDLDMGTHKVINVVDPTADQEGATKNYHDTNRTFIKTGTYTGDGSLGQGITGIGFQPKYVAVWIHLANEKWEKLDQTWGDQAFLHTSASAAPEHLFPTNAINSLDADGFTVDDAGGNLGPNTLDQVYDYLTLG